MTSILGVRTDRQTDRHGFEILTWKHVDTHKISTQSSKLVVSCRSLYAGMHNNYLALQKQEANKLAVQTDRRTWLRDLFVENSRHKKYFRSKSKT